MLALLPPELTVTVSVPSLKPLAVRRPNASNVATSTFELLYVRARPARTLPALSSAEATTFLGKRRCSTESNGAKTMLATGTGMTVSVMFATPPNTVAVRVTVPDANAVTSPVGETVATFVAEDVQEMERMATATFTESFAEATSCFTAPTYTEPVTGAMASDVMDASVVVMEMEPTTPSMVAAMVAVPGATAVRSPVVAPTVTTVVLLEVHAAVLPARPAT